ncbi:hypothetical protein KQI68_01485 [Peptoniphilus sp. MSJ-1]|uniref:SF3 helicase domain-containing protein n=1 Tax=Peptoniphilus ovalis TaxID=2841503 RepID=A0ABS6FEB0_9FIRM|nr:phage/plasmid primase, P4 family [Peptoniphilus ovalis]MBU5668504.1 hypothetical protein [Peptoniphilus ovalis]
MEVLKRDFKEKTEESEDFGLVDLIAYPTKEMTDDVIESILDIKKIEFTPQANEENSNTNNLIALYQDTKLIATTRKQLTDLLIIKREQLEEKKVIKNVTEGQFAMALCNYLNIVNFQGKLYGLTGNWEELETSHSGNLIKYLLNLAGDRKTSYIKEVISQIYIFARNCRYYDNLPILLKNGYLEDGEFNVYDETKIKPFSPYQLNITYHPKCKKVEIIDEYLNNFSTGEKEFRNILEEILGYTLMTNFERKGSLAKFFFIVGDGGNGKGTFLKVISNFLGIENCSLVSSEQIADERYNNNLKGKLANLGDDVPNKPLKDNTIKILKNISSCDEISLRNLFNDAHNYRLTATLIFTSNHILKSWEKDYAFKRRIIWIPMYFKPEKVDPNFLSKLTTKEALEYWLFLAIEGYKRLYKNCKFTDSNIIAEFNKKYHQENNNVEMYLEYKTKDDFVDRKPLDVYVEYENWCEDEGLEPLAKNTLKNTICATYNLVVGSKRILISDDLFNTNTQLKQKVQRVYKKINDTNCPQ